VQSAEEGHRLSSPATGLEKYAKKKRKGEEMEEDYLSYKAENSFITLQLKVKNEKNPPGRKAR